MTPHELLPHLKEELSSKVVFSQDFDDVIVIHQNELSSMVPEELFDEQNSADYLKYNSKILKSDYIANDEVTSVKAKNVYVPYVNINNYIFDTFGQFIYKHSLTVFSEALMALKLQHKDAVVYINLNLNTFEIVVIKQNKLLLTNIHQYYTKEDVLYFILFTFEQLDLNPELNGIVLSGRIIENDALYQEIYKYIRRITFNSTRSSYKDSQGTPIDASRYFLILNSF